ncbi:MAG: SDR family NAD(P)-dependent oxidoreductase [Pikeienuella sp.]|uniref:SDR family NAD(P)-dependent oxidoreductase n=1 Tax=Pikeienuella sp. TaxID=2831957 RepID=UPI00391999E5
MLLENKVCVVTGAASPRSIGFAVAELFAANGAAIAVLDVAVGDRTEIELAERITARAGAAPRLAAWRCDIRKTEECDKVVAEIADRFGTVDCLVNCAGIVASHDLLSTSEAEFDRMIGVNLKGAFNICRSVLAILAEKEGGSIINLASVAAQRGGGLVGGAHYAASKGGVISLTKAIAREYGPKGVRANVICPSMTETGMLDGNVDDEMFQRVVAQIPLRRAGRPSDIAGACLFLASELSAYVTGAVIDVNGGSHIH